MRWGAAAGLGALEEECDRNDAERREGAVHEHVHVAEQGRLRIQRLIDQPLRLVRDLPGGDAHVPGRVRHGDPPWATYKQAAERDWQVRKGSRGTTGFFYKRIEIGDRDNDGDDVGPKSVPVLRAFTLFHASQIDGIPPYVAPEPGEAPWRTPEAAATIARNSGAVIRTGGDQAFYSPRTDHIQLPAANAFRSAAAFASVQLHEQAHRSGSVTGLNRDLSGRFGSAENVREEIVAELAQVFLCATVRYPRH